MVDMRHTLTLFPVQARQQPRLGWRSSWEQDRRLSSAHQALEELAPPCNRPKQHPPPCDAQLRLLRVVKRFFRVTDRWLLISFSIIFTARIIMAPSSLVSRWPGSLWPSTFLRPLPSLASTSTLRFSPRSESVKDPVSVRLILVRIALLVASLRGRAKAGLQNRRRRSSLSRKFVRRAEGRGVEGEVDRVGLVDWVVVVEEDVLVGGLRLAGVEINQLIKRKIIGVVRAEILLGRGDPVCIERNIKRRGSRRRE